MTGPPDLRSDALATEHRAPIDATRYEILRHAEDLFGHYGFRKTSMADIAERAKMSPGNLYRYFRNKQAIAIAVVELFFREAEAAMAAALVPLDDPETRIRGLLSTGCRLVVGEMARNPKIMELVEWLTEEEEAWAKLKEHIDWKRGHVETELAAGIAAGVFVDRPVRATATNIMHATKAFQMP
ncbi:MAG: helix-turn-helix domain-containing protein, partial [Pseudomonadota bacterium]